MRAIRVVVALELGELHLQVGRGPKEHAVQVLAANRPMVRLPSVEFLQPIVIRAEIGRPGVTTRRAVEHPTQPDAIHGVAVHAKADDATGALSMTTSTQWT